MIINKSIYALDFTKENFLNCIAEIESDYPKEKIAKSALFNYFYTYLKGDYEQHGNKGFNANIIVVEDKYVSQSFLEDYASYYSRKFKPYDKFTRRLHFIDAKYDAAFFDANFIEGVNNRIDWTKDYVGYIVIKPVSNAIFGSTLLKTYEDSPHRPKDIDGTNTTERHFTSTLLQPSHLLGREIIIRSLVFQEQDNAVGACATNALWCAYHKTSELFKTGLPSPFQITKSLIEKDAGIDNAFGLDVEQIAMSLKNMGLTWDKCISADNKPLDHTILKRYVYAYGKMGIPILIGFQRDLKLKREEYHLATICGYQINKSLEISEDEIQFKSDFIDQLYTHDDLVGPFSKVTFSTHYFSTKSTNQKRLAVEIIETGHVGQKMSPKRCLPFAIIVPLPPEVTIHYHSIHYNVNLFDTAMKEMTAIDKNAPRELLEETLWEVYLTKGTDYKKSIIEDCKNRETRMKVKITSYPLYIWVGRFINQKTGKPLLDLVFDSTDVGSGFSCYQINIFDEQLRDNIFEMSQTYLRARKDKRRNKGLLPLNYIKLLRISLWNIETAFYGKIGQLEI